MIINDLNGTWSNTYILKTIIKEELQKLNNYLNAN